MAQFELMLVNDEQGKLQVKDFDLLKTELGKLIETQFQVPTLVDNANYVEAKEQRAKLNKVVKLFDSQKADVRKKALEIVGVAERQLKELMGIADAQSGLIDKLIKDYETELEENRKKKAQAIYDETAELNTRGISFPRLIITVGDKWLNATTTEKMIKDDILAFYKKVNDDLEMAKSAFPQYFEYIAEYYLTTFDMLEATKQGKQAWELAQKHTPTIFTNEEIAQSKLALEADLITITFTIRCAKGLVEQLQRFMEHKDIEIINAKKGE